VLDSSLPPDSPSLLDDTTSAELVLTEFIHLGVVSARAGIAELRQMDLKDLAGYGMEEFWQVPQVRSFVGGLGMCGTDGRLSTQGDRHKVKGTGSPMPCTDSLLLMC
jgi:hypothetical protein